jgi:hypothetical protein
VHGDGPAPPRAAGRTATAVAVDPFDTLTGWRG